MGTTAASATERREFAYGDQDFQRVRELIYGRAGISLSPAKKDMVYSRLARRLRVRGMHSFADYLQCLERGDETEWEAFTNALTTNLTSFFREAHHFPLLAEHAQRCWRERRQQLTLWCCASSTGEEPYSMAMTMIDAFSSVTPPVSILATDVDTGVLAKAQNGVYSAERVEKLPAEKLRRFFLKGSGAHDGTVKVRPELQALVTFRRLNLLDKSWAVRAPFDAIFCRNVMIYFDKPTQYQVLERFLPLLALHGLLFAGHSESFTHATDLFRPCGRTVYAPVPRRPVAAAGPAVPKPGLRRSGP